MKAPSRFSVRLPVAAAAFAAAFQVVADTPAAAPGTASAAAPAPAATPAAVASATPAGVPVMEGHETFVLRRSEKDYVVELSGICLSKDGDFLWGVGDNGHFYKIGFDGSYELLWAVAGDFEGLTIDPETGDLYVCDEPSAVLRISTPYKEAVPLFEEAKVMGNSGLEGLTWYRGRLYLGAQTGATLWEYSLSGEKTADKRSLRSVVPTISEIAGLCREPGADRLWALDSNSHRNRPEYLPYTLYLFDGGATRLLASYPLGSFADWNPEGVCADPARGCVWIAEDCGDDCPSKLHKVRFSGL